MSKLKLLFSNRIERLLNNLKAELFKPGQRPFARRILIVPNDAIQSWLMLQIAQDPDLNIAAGMEIMKLSQAFDELANFGDGNEKKYVPSRLELALAIEECLKQTLSSNLLPEDIEIWTPVMNFLKISPTDGKISRKSERRLASLSEKLAGLFEKYGQFGSAMLAEWMEPKAKPQWQQQLWLKLFNEDSPWTYSAENFDSFTFSSNDCSGDIQINLFAFSFLSRSQHTFLMKIAEHLPLHCYVLSPCRAFWLDVQSDWEANKMLSQWKKRGLAENKQIALEGFLRDRNPLLANFGRLGREMATLLEESPAQVEEDYISPVTIEEIPQYQDSIDSDLNFSRENTPFTLLQAVQTDMLLLRNPENTAKIEFQNNDSTLQLHIAPSPAREVEILYHNLLGIISAHAKDENPIRPQDILVMAPDISLYEGHIKAQFGGNDSLLEYQLMDLKMASQSSLVQGFLALLNLSSGRWDAASILQLLEFPEFQRRHNFTAEEVYQIRQWIKDACILWGDDSEHRNDLLSRSHCAQGMVENHSIGTWDEGLSRIFWGLSMVLEDKEAAAEILDTMPLDSVDATLSELLGKVAQLIRSLREDLKLLSERTALPMPDWSSYLQCLLEAYFEVDLKDHKAEEEWEGLLKKIDELRVASKKIEGQFSFISVKRHLDALLSQSTFSYRENVLHAVRFCSMLPMRAIPAKVIYLLGMEEGSFPKNEEKLSLNLMRSHAKCDYSPSSIDYDRFLFLEALVSARRYFCMSYCALNKKEQSPSLLVSELLGYLDKAYALNGQNVAEQIVNEHPFYSFDQRYFSGELNNFSSKYLKAARSFYNADKEPPHRFAPEFFESGNAHHLGKGFDEMRCLDIKSLMEVARNPLKTYFNQALGIYLKDESKNAIKSDESFVVSHLDNHTLCKAALQKPIDQVVALAQKQGALPSGAFKSAALGKFNEDLKEIRQNLSQMGANLSQLFEIEFNSECKAASQIDENSWQVPAVEVRGPDGRVLKIVGKIPLLDYKGLIVFGEGKNSTYYKAWPYFLMLHQAPLSIAKQFLPTEAKKSFECPLKNPEEALTRYVDYYFSCREKMSLLLPEWIPELLKGAEPFKDKVHSSLTNDSYGKLYNDYAHWILDHQDLPEMFGPYEEWRGQAEYLFEDLCAAQPKKGGQDNDDS